jgi:hypothetical protein
VSWTLKRTEYERIVEEIEPASVLTTKDHWIFKVIATLIFWMPNKRWLEEFATTFFPIQAYPSQFPSLSTRLLVHECRHTTHCVWLGYLVPILGWFFGRHVRAWCGAPFYIVLYAFTLFPIGIAVTRWLIEFDCDYTSWKWQVRTKYKVYRITPRAKEFGAKVCGWPYLISWFRWLGGIELFEWGARRALNSAQRKDGW